MFRKIEPVIFPHDGSVARREEIALEEIRKQYPPAITELERHTCYERNSIWLNGWAKPRRCGACGFEMMIYYDPNYCPHCGQNFTRYDYANGEVEKS